MLAEILGLSAGEIGRGMEEAATVLARDPSVRWLLRHGNTAPSRSVLARMLAEGWRPDDSLGDETLDMVRDQFRQFSDRRVALGAHAWHLEDALIPDELVAEMAELGVFGVCFDPQYGGLGLGKLAMCVVSEELSRGWIAAGSLGTRSEIAGKLIGTNGTLEQKARWLPGIASGTILSRGRVYRTRHRLRSRAVKTRARRTENGSWRINRGEDLDHACLAQ